MARLLGLVVILAAIVAGVGYYLGWFHWHTTERGSEVHVGVTVDKAKVQRDTARAEKAITGSVHKADDAVKGIGQPSRPEDRAAYQKEAETRLHDLEQRAKQLEDRVARGTSSVREKMDPQIEVLRKKTADAQVKLGELKAAGADAWTNAKAKMQQALDELQKEYDRTAPQAP